jgi:hypothetical protein
MAQSSTAALPVKAHALGDGRARRVIQIFCFSAHRATSLDRRRSDALSNTSLCRLRVPGWLCVTGHNPLLLLATVCRLKQGFNLLNLCAHDPTKRFEADTEYSNEDE